MAKGNRIEKSAKDRERSRKRGAEMRSAVSVKPGKGKLNKAEIEEREEVPAGDSTKITKERIVSNIVQFWNAAVKVFQPDWKRGKENLGLVYEEHWDESDQSNHLLAGRTALNMPGVFSKAQTLLGWEKNNREQFETEAKGAEDELTAEIMNWIFRHIENNDDPKKYEYTKSDVFFDGIIPYCGCNEIYVETNELGENEIKMRQLDYNEVVWERNFTDVEMTGCSRQAHGREVFIDELKQEYPLLAEEIGKMPSEYMVEENYGQVTDAEKQELDLGDTKRKRCMKIRDWKLVNRIVYEVHCIADDKIEAYYDEAEAKARRMALMDEKRIVMKQEQQMVAGITPMLGQVGVAAPPVMTDEQIEKYLEEDYIIKEVPKRLIEHTIIAGNVILKEPHILEVDEMPLTFYFSIFLKGKVLTIIDVVKHLQQYFDKQFSQMDYDLGVDTKNAKVLFSDMVDEEYQTVEEAMEALSEGNVIVAKGVPAQGNPIHVVQRSGIQPNTFPIFELLLKLMEDAFGGRNFQGAQETGGGGQSGKAIAKLQAAAALIALNYMDNLRRFDMQVGKKLVKYVKKFYTHKFALKVLGESLSEQIKAALEENDMYQQSSINSGLGWVTVNDPDNPKTRPLSDANLSLTVRRVTVRQDEKDVEYEKLMGVKNLGYAVPVDAFLDTMNVKPTLKSRIVKENEKQQAIMERQLVLQEKQAELQANMKVADMLKPDVKAEVNPEGVSAKAGTNGNSA